MLRALGLAQLVVLAAAARVVVVVVAGHPNRRRTHCQLAIQPLMARLLQRLSYRLPLVELQPEHQRLG